MSSVSVTFQLFISRNITEHDVIDESELVARFEDYRPVLARKDEHYGAVVFRSASAQAAFEDDLWHLVFNLCFRSIPALADAGTFRTRLYVNPGEILMRRDGESVHIEDDQGVSIEMPWPDVAPALVACGERFIALLRRLDGQPVNAKLIAMLEEQRQPALEILRKL
ncbi:MAG: hypothetical protein ACREXX_00290 [Gammaproteobacteria bacterium]